MGLDAFCSARDAYPNLAPSLTEDRSQYVHLVVCAPYSRPLSVDQELGRIAEGVAQGLIAAAPYVSLGVQAVACLSGQIYACASGAADAAQLAGAGEELGVDELAEFLELTGKIYDCASGTSSRARNWA
jgi:hypothetical protein